MPPDRNGNRKKQSDFQSGIKIEQYFGSPTISWGWKSPIQPYEGRNGSLCGAMAFNLKRVILSLRKQQMMTTT